MNPAGTDYLLRLAALSLSFVGFSAIVVTLRRALGGELAEGHIRLVRLYIETGLAVTALSLVPTLLTFLGVSEAALWRVASAMAGSLLTLLMIVQFRRRRRIEGRFPPWVVVMYLTSAAAVVALWLNVVGIPYGPGMAPYAVSLTWSLLVSGYIFLQTLDLFLRSSPPGSDIGSQKDCTPALSMEPVPKEGARSSGNFSPGGSTPTMVWDLASMRTV